MSTLVLAAGHTSDPTVVHTLVHAVLPTFALAFGLMAVIWLACAVVTFCGAYLGGLAFVGVRGLIRACTRRVRHRRDAECAQLVTVHPDGVTTKIINLDHYRHRHQPRHGRPHTTERADDPESRSDGPA